MADTNSKPRNVNVPRHIAIIMDGNGRWARKRLMPRFAGHKAGLESVRKTVKSCLQHEVEVLTLFAFSSENWRRPQEEVGLLMNLFMTALDREVKKLHEVGVKLHIIGDVSAFSPELQQRIVEAEALTRNNDKLILNVAVNYGGRWDIAEAARKLARRVANGEIDAEAITPELMSSEISLAEQPEPDLFIRTGGEKRISNFLLWQLAYTELYFSDELWPDFNESSFVAALESFAGRQRRFGRTGEQVESENA